LHGVFVRLRSYPLLFEVCDFEYLCPKYLDFINRHHDCNNHGYYLLLCLMNEAEIQNAVEAIVKGWQTQLQVTNMDDTLNGTHLTIRETIRLAFQHLGVEVEFSGKGPHERGVVIDMDADQMTELGLDADILRFGQTVVRVNPL
jgi:hypothetical protein